MVVTKLKTPPVVKIHHSNVRLVNLLTGAFSLSTGEISGSRHPGHPIQPLF
jgi:hypothetical protein